MNAPDAWRLPWKGKDVPHAILDIIRGCNITCEACYNARPPSVKPVAQVESELDALQRHRRLSSVSIVGGEVLMHPQLADIIRMVKRRRIDVEIFTNGLLLTTERLQELQQAGLDVAFLHIEGGQNRPDLPMNPSVSQLRAVWQSMCSRVASHGIEPGLVLTAHASRIPELDEIIRFTLESEHAHALVVTLCRDLSDVACIRGDIHKGMRAERHPNKPPATPTLTNWHIRDRLEQTMALRPFAYMGSNLDPNDPRWLSYLVATSRGHDGQRTECCVKASIFEKTIVQLLRLTSGRFPMFRKQNARQLRIQLTFNGLTGGNTRGNFRFLRATTRGPAPLLAKRLLFQNPAEADASGQVIHCAHCPDAVIFEGHLVPVCLTDKIATNP